MNLVTAYFRDLFRGTIAGWSRFWFTPADPATLGLLRILAGSMLLYTHLVWTLDLTSFFGPRGWVSPQALAGLPPRTTWGIWSYFDWIHSPAVLWTVHGAALIVFFLLTIGLFSRATAILGFLATVAYANRVMPFALFGLDDINAMLALYLAVSPCGAVYSLDRLLARRRAGRDLPVEPRIDANVAIRLIQVHMCVIYTFSALGKLMGASWWGGMAIWLAVANREYQSLDLTWLAAWPLLVNFLTHATVLWELSYCVLVWPRLTRPLMIALAVPIHLGIAVALGMTTFGLVMLIGNVAFVSPALVRRIFDRRPLEQGRGGERHTELPAISRVSK